MKYFIASDIHGSSFYCDKMIEAFKREKADKLILLGDILYHGPRNDLPEGYAPKQVIPMLNEIKNKILCVRGNCDSEVDQMVLEFPITADYGILSVNGRSIYFTHGHNHNLDKLPPLSSGDILLHGHTHIPAWQSFGDDNLYLNPGSVSLPKENTQHGYMTVEEGKICWKNLDSTVYHEIEI